MPIATGSKLGPYEILAAAGAGGMGEVYRAKDTRLDRVVAVKVLSAHLSSDPHFRERFEREARTVSSLQHPNICVLHDVGRHGDVDYLVMEFLEGETLADRLMKGPLPAEQCTRYATETADALDRAHKAGIIHRDLKPGNIMLTKSGAKILDFGLAKEKPQAMAASAMTAMVTQTKPLTGEGNVVGTFQYMAPETLEGGEADARSDIFSFGAVVYEMLTGKRAFSGKTQASVIASILASEPPPLSSIAPMTPPALDRVVRTCLAKDPDERFQSAHDIVLQLKWIAEAGSQAGVPAPVVVRRKHRERMAWTIAALLFVVAAVLGGMYWRAQGETPRVVRALIPEPLGVHFLFSGDTSGAPVVSPDGAHIAYVAIGQGGRPTIWVRPTDGLNGTPLPGTEDAKFPFWSPDSRSVGFFQVGKLRTAEISGAPPLTVADAPDGRGGSWGADGTILYTPDTRAALWRVAASGGGTPQVVTKVSNDQTTHRWPEMLPDGKHFLYVAANHNNPRSDEMGVYYASLDGKENRRLLRCLAQTAYQDGYLLFMRENTLLAQRFDPDSGKLSGEPLSVATNVGYDLSIWRGVFSVGGKGLLVYQLGGAGSGSRLVWFDRSGKRLGVVGEMQVFADARLAPDAKRAVVTIGDANSDLYIYDLEKNTRTRLTFQPGLNVGGLWSPDSKQIAFASDRVGAAFNVYVKPADGTADEQLLLPRTPGAFRAPADWSSGYLLYVEGTNFSDLHIWAVPMVGERKPFPVVADRTVGDAVLSPDGKWLAYTSGELSQPEIFVTRFPTGGGKWQISSGGGAVPRWRRDGKELLYMALDRTLMSVPVGATATGFEVGTPVALFRTTGVSTPGYSFDLSPDGQRILINSLDEQTAAPVVLVVNWPADLKKK
jgi:Tol biopolymer transport system component